jgi:hypothetical protein
VGTSVRRAPAQEAKYIIRARAKKRRSCSGWRRNCTRSRERSKDWRENGKSTWRERQGRLLKGFLFPNFLFLSWSICDNAFLLRVEEFASRYGKQMHSK